MNQRNLSLASVAVGCLIAVWSGSGLGACARGATTSFGEYGGGDVGGGANTTTWDTTTTHTGTTTTNTNTETTTTTTHTGTTTTTWSTTTTTTTSGSGGCDPATEFDCGDGTCIPLSYVCDGQYLDCADGSDEDPALCGGGGWTCDPSYEGDGYCDCGCGVTDSDCYDGSLSSCEYCDAPGDCDPGDCSTIDPNDNAVCI